ncbi:MAG TPA: hypothetical protein VN028_06015 [Rhodocyclaceae bacterium]|nr:hypothetical protein [Rhodocyclaceae bacterium]
MRKSLIRVLGLALFATAAGAHADSVSISVGQPGFYGHIDIGGYPAPQLVYPEPVLAQAVPYGGPPVYVYAPPRHIHHWQRYCGRYGACGRPVYFVQDRWYQRVYVPQYRHRHEYERDYAYGGYGRGHGHGPHHHGHDRD